MAMSPDLPDRERDNEALREQIKKLEEEASRLRERNEVLQAERNAFATFVPPEWLKELSYEESVRFYQNADQECTLELKDVLAEIEGMIDEPR